MSTKNRDTVESENTSYQRSEKGVKVDDTITSGVRKPNSSSEEVSSDIKMAGISPSKESVIVKLNAKVKSLEKNLTMSMTYLELMSEKYRKAMMEGEKKADKKLTDGVSMLIY